MHVQSTVEKQRERISKLQQVVWDLENVRLKLTDIKCSTSVLQAVEVALDKAQQELNDISTLM